MSSDAPQATYRGYRLQALYILHRILVDSDAADKVYKPEGAEDLEIQDLDGRAIEHVQVKAYSEDLSLSTFKLEKPNCYFWRVYRRTKTGIPGSNVLASYGPLGAELAAALGGNDRIKRNLAKKLSKQSMALSDRTLRMNHNEALRVISSISVSQVIEETLTEQILSKLRLTMMGLEPKVALELLLWSVFRASEIGEFFTRERIQERATEIGEALSNLSSFHQEWGISVISLSTENPSEERRKKLEDGFRQGDRATWEHIQAKVDAPRTQRLLEIHAKLQTFDTVILHAASGQGKSTLGFRYMHEYCPAPWRFYIKLVATRDQAIRIANALAFHAKQLGISANIFLDVDPNDTGWSELVRELSKTDRVKLLVAVREDDFQKAAADFSASNITELALDGLDESEARLIYAALTTTGEPREYLNFEDAWCQFTQGNGAKPLMEFTYILTHGQSLRQRLRAQVSHLQNEIRNGCGDLTAKELRLLALVSIAGAFECRLDAVRLCMHLEIEILANPFAPFEREFLLRYSSDLASVGGLHPIRSQIIVDLLLENSPAVWGQMASECVPLLVASDIEPFLLRAFSRRPDAIRDVSHVLSLLSDPDWDQLGGITSALLWLGLSQFEETNREHILEAIQKMGEAWWFVLDVSVGEADSASFANLRTLLAQFAPDADKYAPELKKLHKAAVFQPLDTWARNFASKIRSPRKEADWAGLSTCAFWLGQTKTPGLVRDALDNTDLWPIIADVGIRTASRVMLGLWNLNNPKLQAWYRQNRGTLRSKFLMETNSLTLAFDFELLSITSLLELPLSLTPSPEELAGADFERLLTERIELARELFPDFAEYSCEVVGLNALPIAIPRDFLRRKSAASRLVLRPQSDLNGTFHALVDYRHVRLASWEDYLEKVMKIRKEAGTSIKVLLSALDTLLRSEQKGKAFETQPLIAATCESLSAQLSFPAFPQCAVDEWGFTSESRAKQSAPKSNGASSERGLMLLKSYSKAAHEFSSNLSWFFRHFAQASRSAFALRATNGDELAAAAKVGNTDQFDESRKKTHNCLFCIGSALETARSFQREFRIRFAKRLPAGQLDEIDRQENRYLEELWALSFELLENPTQQLREPTEVARAIHRQKRERFVTFVKMRLAGLQSKQHQARIINERGVWSKRTALWVVANTCDPSLTETLVPKTFSHIWEATKLSGITAKHSPLIKAEWGYVVIVPQFRGRSLARIAAPIPSRYLFEDNLESVPEIYTMGSLVGEHAWNPLELPVWTHPVGGLIIKWAASTFLFVNELEAVLHLFSAILHDLDNPEMSDVKTCQEERLSKRLSKALNGSHSAYNDLKRYLESRIQSSLPPIQKAPEILQKLVAWGAHVYPQEKGIKHIMELNISTYQDWFKSILNATQQLSGFVSSILDAFLSDEDRLTRGDHNNLEH